MAQKFRCLVCGEEVEVETDSSSVECPNGCERADGQALFGNDIVWTPFTAVPLDVYQQEKELEKFWSDYGDY